MADSAYYYKLYKQKKNNVKDYDGNLKDLRKVLRNLTDNMDDEIRGVNNELDDLSEDLSKAIRHNSRFSTHSDAATSKREKSVASDSLLRVAAREIEEEITRISNSRSRDVQDRDYYYNQYKRKLEEERQALLEKII